MKEKNKIILPCGKFGKMYYCKDCRHINFSDLTKDGEAASCEKKNGYKILNKDHGCSDWEPR